MVDAAYLDAPVFWLGDVVHGSLDSIRGLGPIALHRREARVIAKDHLHQVVNAAQVYLVGGAET